jgi:hypothetical protein
VGVVRGDRIGESRRLNRCSNEAQDFYAAFIAAVPDDFGRYRHSLLHIALAMYPRREPNPASLRRIGRLLEELVRHHLVATWEVDGVTFGEIDKWKPTGNKYHRTPEPPASSHVHAGRCLATAIHRAREWGMLDEAHRLSLLFSRLRDRNPTGARPGPDQEVDQGPDSPSPPSPPSPPLRTTDNGHPPIPPADAGGDRPRSAIGLADQVEALASYAKRIGGHPGRRERRAYRDALRAGHTIEAIRSEIAEAVKRDLVSAGRFDWNAPWPPPEPGGALLSAEDQQGDFEPLEGLEAAAEAGRAPPGKPT